MQEQRHGFGRGALRGLTLAACALLPVESQAATRGYTLTGFDAIRLEAPISVVVTSGTGTSARAEGDQAVLDRLRVEVSGRLLKISMERTSGDHVAGPATLRLGTAEVDRIVMIGGGSLTLDRMRGQRGDIVLGGSGDISIASVTLDQLSLTVSGAGRATLAGQAGMAIVRVTGPGAVAAEGLRVRQAHVSNDGPGSTALTADVTARVSASGSGDVAVGGKAACTVDRRGTGSLSCGGEDY